jgi:hypothetical protein
MTNETGAPGESPQDTQGESNEVIAPGERRPAVRARPGQLEKRRRAGLPAPVAKAAVAVAAGAALQVGVGLAGKFLAYRAGKGAASGLGSKALRARSNNHKKPVEPVEEEDDERGTVVSETLIVRRVWLRKDRK